MRSDLGLSQAALADRLGATKRSVVNWEGGQAAPGADVLARYAEAGADVLYVLTGQYKGDARPAPTLTDDERELLALYRAAPLAVKAAAIGALSARGGGKAGQVRDIVGMTNNAPGGIQVGMGKVVVKKGSG